VPSHRSAPAAPAIWAGCVATEAVLEVALEKAPPQSSGLALLRAKIARFVEIPAIVLALLNSIAAFTVHRRLQCLNAQDMAGYQRFNTLHERIGIGCVLSIVGAIAVGGCRIAV